MSVTINRRNFFKTFMGGLVSLTLPPHLIGSLATPYKGPTSYITLAEAAKLLSADHKINCLIDTLCEETTILSELKFMEVPIK